MTEEATNETGKNVGDENPAGEEGAADGNKESLANGAEEQEPEDKVNSIPSLSRHLCYLDLSPCLGIHFC